MTITPGPRHAIAVVGAGLRSPGGNTIDALWDSLLASVHTSEVFHDDRLPAGAGMLVSRVKQFDAAPYCTAAEMRRLDRSQLLAIAAAHDAVDCLRGPMPPPERRAVVCGVGFGAMSTYELQHERLTLGGMRAVSPLVIPTAMPNGAASHLSIRFQAQGPCITVSTACASGATAIGEGMEILRRGAADLVIAGGVDSMVSYGAMVAFQRLEAMSRNVDDPSHASRPFDVGRDGFVMGEGAGFLVLMRDKDAAAEGHNVLGRILGYGSCADASHLVAPSEDGSGALRCMRLSLTDAGAGPGDVNHVNSHGTSTVLNDFTEGLAIAKLFGRRPPPVAATKGTTGHMIGAAGAVEAIVTIRSLRAGLVPPVTGHRDLDPRIDLDVVCGTPRRIDPGLGISNSFGFGGSNASLVFAAS